MNPCDGYLWMQPALQKTKKSAQRTLALQHKEPAVDERPPKEDENESAPIDSEVEPATEQ